MNSVCILKLKARFKLKTSHFTSVPNTTRELTACEMRRLNQSNSTVLNLIRLTSNLRLKQSNIRLKFDI